MKKIIKKLLDCGTRRKECVTCVNSGDKIYIGDVLERMIEIGATKYNGDNILKLATFWLPCGLTKSLQQIEEESGYEEYCGVCKVTIKECKDGEACWYEERLKDPNARKLEEFLNQILIFK